MRLRARVTARHTCADRDWNVENGFGFGFELAVALIWSIADSENLKTFTLTGGSGLLVSGARGRLSFMRVLRALVRSRNGGTEMVWAPLQIWAHEVIKCHMEVPSRIAWLNAHPHR